MKRFLLLVVLCLFSLPAKANNYVIDLSTTPLNNTFPITCYCGYGFGQDWSFAAQPGDTFDFGSIVSYPQTFYLNGDPGMPGLPPPFLGVFHFFPNVL